MAGLPDLSSVAVARVLGPDHVTILDSKQRRIHGDVLVWVASSAGCFRFSKSSLTWVHGHIQPSEAPAEESLLSNPRVMMATWFERGVSGCCRAVCLHSRTLEELALVWWQKLRALLKVSKCSSIYKLLKASAPSFECLSVVLRGVGRDVESFGVVKVMGGLVVLV